jgi:hypothetical protein
VIGKAHRLGLFGQYLPPGKGRPRSEMSRTAPLNRSRLKHLQQERATPAEVIHVAAPVTTPQPARLKIRPGHASQRAKEVQWIEPTEALDLPPDQSEFACTIAELGADMCRWPLGPTAADMRYCGSECVGTYCQRHRAIAYRKVGVIA